MSAATRWWWVRHAPVPGRTGNLYGQSDVECDVTDRTAIGACAALLPRDAVLVTSPLRRTHQTLDALLAGLAGQNGPPLTPIVEPRFAEQHFGRWQGHTWSEIETEDAATFGRFWQDPTSNAPPGGESFSDQIARTRAGITALNSQFPGRDIVCVAHAGTIRAAVAVALGLSPATAMSVVIDNLSLSRIEWLEDGILRGHAGHWRVAGINVVCPWICQKPTC